MAKVKETADEGTGIKRVMKKSNTGVRRVRKVPLLYYYFIA